MYYKVIPYSGTKGTLYLSPHSFPHYYNTDSVKVSLGHGEQQVEVIKDSNINDNEFALSEDIIQSLMIPSDVEYQVRFEEDKIRIGPVIGLLLERGGRSIVNIKPDELISYTLIYPNIHGLLIVFGAEDIDFSNKTVHGYYYSPEDYDGKVMWKESILPLPDAIFVRRALKDDIRLKLKRITKNRIFNSYYFNKWEFWEIVSAQDSLRGHIPDTRLFSSIDDIHTMLEKYGSVYLKPVNGTLARGLMKITKASGDEYIIQLKDETEFSHSYTRGQMSKYISSVVNNHRYIVQQALKPVMVEGRHMDFRVIMQKNHTRKWGCTGIISFLGNPRGIVSNWGYETSFEEIFAKQLNFKQQDIYKKKQDIINVCKKVCEAMDSTGENYGDLGFDVLLDESLKVWVLEVNKRHYHSVPLWIGDRQTFYALKSNIIKYATSLSGFDVYE